MLSTLIEKIIFIIIFLIFFLPFIYFLIFKDYKKIILSLDLKEKLNLNINPKLVAFWFWFNTPFIKLLLKLKTHPNMITMLNPITSIIPAILFAYGYLVWGAFVLIFTSNLDALDGYIAKKQNLATKSGAFLDSTLDRLSDLIVLLGLLYYFKDDKIFFLILSLIIIFTASISYTKENLKLLTLQTTKA